MARIFINGTSAKSAGGKSILRNLLGSLAGMKLDHTWVVAVPAGHGYFEFDQNGIEIVELSDTESLVDLARLTFLRLPKMLRESDCDILLNLADVPIPTSRPQVFLFDWAYAAFPDSRAWHLSSRRDRLVRNAKLNLFRMLQHHIDVIIAQNAGIKTQLQKIYDFRDVVVVPNAVSLENLSEVECFDFDLPSGFKLLCLSAYYTHKNLEVLIPVAELIKAQSLDYRLVVTIAADQHPRAAAFLAMVQTKGLGDVIVNAGPVPMSRVPSLYRQTDALLLPTLLESFSGTYVEAMFHRRPILTSSLPFAEGVCGDAALYFDPLNPHEILRQIKKICSDVALRNELVDRGSAVLERLPNWPQATSAIIDVLERVLAIRTRH